MKVAVLTMRKKSGKEVKAVFETEAGAVRFISGQGFINASGEWVHPRGITASVEVTERTADMPETLLP